MADLILVLNAGSSSIKFKAYDVASSREGSTAEILRGSIDGLYTDAKFTAILSADSEPDTYSWSSAAAPGHAGAVAFLADYLRGRGNGHELVAVGHRVVHGGVEFTQPIRLTPHIVEKLARLNSLAPLHQPHNLKPIQILMERRPELPQVACFDTAFHATQPPEAYSFALPASITDRGVRRYGFHGLSYEYIASVLPSISARAASGRTIVAHLGNGSSMCAMVNGKSVASTMGFTAVDGLPMGSRCGAIDPGVLLYCMDELGMDARAIESLLYKQSGLLGVSGISSDMRVLLGSDHASAKLAVDIYTYRINRELGSLVAAAQGLDALVFTAGIGENSPTIRQMILRRASWSGAALDDQANETGAVNIGIPGGVEILVIPTNEELMIANHTWCCLHERGSEP